MKHAVKPDMAMDKNLMSGKLPKLGKMGEACIKKATPSGKMGGNFAPGAMKGSGKEITDHNGICKG